MSSDLMAVIDELAVHAGAAIGALRQSDGRLDMRQIADVLLLVTTGRPFISGEEAALADAEHATHMADREAGTCHWV